MPQVGPAYVIVGSHQGASIPVKAPPGIHYLLVTLASARSISRSSRQSMNARSAGSM